jgi:hypothetical protein
MTLLCEKENIVFKPKEVKTRSSLAESSKEGYGSKRAVLSMLNLASYSSHVAKE